MELGNLKVGDNVTVRHVGGAGQELREKTKVVKVTKTQITVEGGIRFLKNGNRLGEAKKTRGWFTFLELE